MKKENRTGTEGVVYLLSRSGGIKVDHHAASRGIFRWAAGSFRQVGGGWGPIDTARRFTAAERESAIVAPDSVWVPVFVNVDPEGGQA